MPAYLLRNPSRIASLQELEKLKDLLLGIARVELDPYAAAIGAGEIFFSCRKAGITIRKSNDCLIAFYCISSNLVLLHRDRDFDLISKIINLKMLK